MRDFQSLSASPQRSSAQSGMSSPNLSSSQSGYMFISTFLFDIMIISNCGVKSQSKYSCLFSLTMMFSLKSDKVSKLVSKSFVLINVFNSTVSLVTVVAIV